MLPVLIRANFQAASRFRLLLHSLLPIKSLQHIACGLWGGHRTLASVDTLLHAERPYLSDACGVRC